MLTITLYSSNLLARVKNNAPKLPMKPALSDTRPVNMLQLLVQQREAEKEADLKAENDASKDASENEDDDNKENVGL